MNKYIVILFMLFTAFSFSQNKKDWEKIKSLKVAYITEKLSLDSREAQEFWPIYNEYEEKRHALGRKDHNEIRSKLKNSDDLTEKDAKKLLALKISIEEDEEELDKALLLEVSKVTSAKKALLLLKAEEDFKRDLIKQYRHNKGGK
ncbi:hypothetical protein Q2T41_01655 [Maribacter confluentis]|uniref:Sensor of ECF-type sigma factor n=2 Tax=Maribacter TaxID=252356 RepID=A0ABY1SFQ8_9FLAO|nr:MULTISPECIES: hypothetical protein [Maribacter]MDO1511369.1 hypothetical protein [Maribacter confluentis]TVZ14571.1 hypothetical protein JM81_0776 [Maribacter sp. MAR_2009_72]SNR42881.1 hypothetical protein SAMN04488009_1627 [Maribacter sedimenticola]